MDVSFRGGSFADAPNYLSCLDKPNKTSAGMRIKQTFLT